MLPHNKIIKTTAKKFLEPENLFQIGNSRTWLDDCGYYAIIVDFYSRSYVKGAGLDVGVTFLWEFTKSLSETLAYNYYTEVYAGFIEYKNDDETFQIGIERLAKKALEKINEYRKFSDMDYVKSCLKNRASQDYTIPKTVCVPATYQFPFLNMILRSPYQKIFDIHLFFLKLFLPIFLYQFGMV